jgi:hypothetical protein
LKIFTTYGEQIGNYSKKYRNSSEAEAVKEGGSYES